MTPAQLKTFLENIAWPYPKIKKDTGYAKQYIWQMLKKERRVNPEFIQKLKDALIREGNKLLRLAEKL